MGNERIREVVCVCKGVDEVISASRMAEGVFERELIDVRKVG